MYYARVCDAKSEVLTMLVHGEWIGSVNVLISLQVLGDKHGDAVSIVVRTSLFPLAICICDIADLSQRERVFNSEEESEGH